MEYVPLVSIPLIYLVVAILKPLLQPKLPFNICAICVAVSSTWLILLVLWLLGFSVSWLGLGILMGMSVTGIMYKAEGLYKTLKIKNFWLVRVVIILGGFYAVFALLQKDWPLFSVVAIASLLLVIISTFLFQGITHEQVVAGTKQKKTIVQKLEDCC